MSNATMTVQSSNNGWTALKVECNLCSHVTFTGRPDVHRTTADEILADHLDQHRPGRTFDIEVEWTPIAECPTCDDGGDIAVDDDGDLECRNCKTYWDIDGTEGHTRDDA